MARSKRWVVDSNSPGNLDGILAALGVGQEALAQGRVFVGRKRVSSARLSLRPGDVVEVFATESPGLTQRVQVLDRREGVLAVLKPAGMSTQPDHRGSEGSLQAEVARLEGIADASRVHATSRLDREVSGVVLFALTAKAREALRTAREQGQYQRHYVAIAAKAPEPAAGEIALALGRSSDPRLRTIGGRDAQPSLTRYQTIQVRERGTLIGVEPVTGRTHQIRVHLAHQGAPLLGDSAYGGPSSLVLDSGAVLSLGRIALHAAWVQVRGIGASPWNVQAPVPEELALLWNRLGGEQGAWQEALCSL